MIKPWIIFYDIPFSTCPFSHKMVGEIKPMESINSKFQTSKQEEVNIFNTWLGFC